MKLIITMILCVTITQACFLPLLKGISKHKCHKFPAAPSVVNSCATPTPTPPIYQPQPPTPQAPLRNNFILTLDYACRQHVPFHSCTGAVQWNGVTIYEIKPCNYAINPLHLTLAAKVGTNQLRFVGTGNSDHYGLTIDNIKLTRNGDTQNIVVNGGFEEPNVNGDWKHLNNIKGWNCHEIQIGRGSIYNCGWKSQVCELDSSKNTAISQKFKFNKNFELVNSCGRKGCRQEDSDSDSDSDSSRCD